MAPKMTICGTKNAVEGSKSRSRGTVRRLVTVEDQDGDSSGLGKNAAVKIRS